MNSLFFISSTGEIFIEKHCKGVIHKAVCDYFFDAQNKASSPEEIVPVIVAPHHFLINVYRNGVFIVAVCTVEQPPLFVIEFLHRVFDVLTQYFNVELNEHVLKEQIVLVYNVLDEMLENGMPMSCEVNVIQDLIKPRNLMRTVRDTLKGESSTVASTLPKAQLSNVPWRRDGIKYLSNEAFFDVIEEIDAIIDRSGGVVMADIRGRIECLTHLTGMPDMTMNFSNPQLMDDVAFHPCVRFRRWENEKVLSFIPPDGSFQLLTYHVGTQNVPIPLQIRHSVAFRSENSGSVELVLQPRHTLGRALEQVRLVMHLPKSATQVNFTVTSGRYSFDTVTRTVSWDLGKIETTGGATPTLRGSVLFASGSSMPESHPTVDVHFVIPQIAFSGLRVARVEKYGEAYNAFKGVKYVSRSGHFQVRT